MQITYLDEIGSTQTYLKEQLKNNISLPHAIVAHRQTSGVGSRDNSWTGMEGNLFLSFALKLSDLPKDLKFESASIYFSYLLKETLSDDGSQVWLKWPNDFYMDEKKAGGMITNIVGDTLICGVGLNLCNAPEDFAVLDVTISKEKLLEKYFKKVEKKFSWKQVFSKYELEFSRNKNFFTHKNDVKISLESAVLQEDGSIVYNGERIYSLR